MHNNENVFLKKIIEVKTSKYNDLVMSFVLFFLGWLDKYPTKIILLIYFMLLTPP